MAQAHPPTGGERPLVWFRRDLRIADQPALAEACRASAAGVVGVFAFTPRQWREHGDAPCKVDLLRRSVAALSAGLAERGIPLRIVRRPRFADLPAALLELAREHGCTSLWCNEEHEVHERRRDAAVQEAFEGAGLPVHAFLDQILVAPEVLRTGQGRPYRVYTPFRRAWLAHAAERGLPRLYGEPPAVAPLSLAADPVPEKLAGYPIAPAAAALWPAGEDAALAHLQAFCDGPIRDYHQMRDFPGRDGTSGLSPALALGLLSPRRCLEAARRTNGGRLSGGAEGPDTWISELLWREFYRHVLVNFPRVSMHRAFRPESEAIPWREDEAGFAAWCEGRTGFPIVDAAMRQLAATGWMHNRLRMITAMFLTKDLLIDWRQGEAFFMQHLVDGDLANNNGGWQWSASTGTDAAPWFRVFNPTSQGRKFDPDGSFVRAHVAELAGVDGPEVHEPGPEVRRRCGYPEPIVDHRQARQRVLEVFRTAQG